MLVESWSTGATDFPSEEGEEEGEGTLGWMLMRLPVGSDDIFIKLSCEEVR